MASTYPNSLDSLPTNHVAGETILASTINDVCDAVNKLEAEGGVLPKGPSASVRARLDKLMPTSPSAYTVSNGTTNRSLNVTGGTADQLAQVVGTLLADLQARGIIG